MYGRNFLFNNPEKNQHPCNFYRGRRVPAAAACSTQESAGPEAATWPIGAAAEVIAVTSSSHVIPTADRLQLQRTLNRTRTSGGQPRRRRCPTDTYRPCQCGTKRLQPGRSGHFGGDCGDTDWTCQRIVASESSWSTGTIQPPQSRWLPWQAGPAQGH